MSTVEISERAQIENASQIFELLNIEFLSTQTKELCNETYYYDILFVGAASNIYYVEGKITVKKSVTR